jgi:streptogramin lyase
VNSPPQYFQAVFATALAAVMALALAGCSGNGAISDVTPPPGVPPVVPPTGPGLAFTGTVNAGTQPVAGAAVQLYAAGTTGNGSAATALLSTTVTTDATGSFTIPAGYTCPASSSQLYLIARGGSIAGTPASPTGTTAANSSIALLSTIGVCSQIVTASHFVLNEVTTVANVWALSQFLSNGGNLGASATNTVGLANAVATAANLANPATGTSPGTTFPAIASSPAASSSAARINTLANLLNTCTRSSSTSAACTNLTATLQNPDTLDAALHIVRNAAANVPALYTQSKASTAFSPILAAAPADWTLFVNYSLNSVTGTNLSSPSGIAVDSTGSVWVSDYFGYAFKFSPTGQLVFPSGITGFGLSNSYGLAIDARDNAWIPNEPGARSSVTVLNSSGQPISGSTGFTAGGLNYPLAIAIDPNGTSWVLDYGNSHLTQLSSSGTPLSGATGYTSDYFAFPNAIAIDANHNAWVTNQSGSNVVKVSPDGKTFNSYNCCDRAAGLAIDQLGNVWVANYSGDSISEVSSSGTVLLNGITAGNTVYHPQGIAIDGAGNVWIANFLFQPNSRITYLTELAGASSTSSAPGQPLSPSPGWAPDAGLAGPFALAIDASGNIWVSDFFGNSITEFIGAAAPVKTPLLGPPQTP